MRSIAWRSRGAWLTLALALAACAGGPDKPRPRPLQPLTPQPVATPAWSQRVGAVQFPLAATAAGDSFTVASSDGTVAAIDAATGRDLWRTQVGGEIRAGVGSDGTRAALVTRAGELVLVEQGQVRWRKALPGRVVTAPLVAGARVFILGVDRSVQAFDAADGAKLWSVQRPGDPLALAQPGVLAAFKNTLIAGQGPRMAGLDPAGGAVRWEVPIAAPRGANEVERLADLVGPAARVGAMLCARAFQVSIGCVDADRGTSSWTRNTTGNDAIAADGDFVFGADANDRMGAWRTREGTVAWTSEALLYRGLAAPVVHGNSVVYGDAAGMLHWFSRDAGEAQLRLPTDGSAVVTLAVGPGGTLLAVTRSGGLFAFRKP